MPAWRPLFDAFLRAILDVAAVHRGFTRSVTGRPSDGDYLIAIEFDGRDALHRWNETDAWTEWLETARRLTSGALRLDGAAPAARG